MKIELDLPIDDCWEAVDFRPPMEGEMFYSCYMGGVVLSAAFDETQARIILRKKAKWADAELKHFRGRTTRRVRVANGNGPWQERHGISDIVFGANGLWWRDCEQGELWEFCQVDENEEESSEIRN